MHFPVLDHGTQPGSYLNGPMFVTLEHYFSTSKPHYIERAHKREGNQAFAGEACDA
jgi:hypothetical protein